MNISLSAPLNGSGLWPAIIFVLPNPGSSGSGGSDSFVFPFVSEPLGTAGAAGLSVTGVALTSPTTVPVTDFNFENQPVLLMCVSELPIGGGSGAIICGYCPTGFINQPSCLAPGDETFNFSPELPPALYWDSGSLIGSAGASIMVGTTSTALSLNPEVLSVTPTYQGQTNLLHVPSTGVISLYVGCQNPVADECFVTASMQEAASFSGGHQHDNGFRPLRRNCLREYCRPVLELYWQLKRGWNESYRGRKRIS